MSINEASQWFEWNINGWC